MLKKKKIYPAYVSKYNSNREKQVILLMSSNGEKWHYLAVKKLPALLRGIMYELLQLLSFFRKKNKIQSHKKVCKNKDFCNVIMPSEDTEILGFNRYEKSDEEPFIFYADLECILEKIDGCKNDPKNLSTTKVNEHIPLRFSISTVSSFRNIEIKPDVCRGKYPMETFCGFLREQARKVINFKDKKIKFLSKEQNELYENAKICYICKETF